MKSPSILWWTIDSVRRDHCSAYGYERETTPNLNSFDGQLYKGISHGTWTLPSATSILTAQTPEEHNVTNKGDALHWSVPTVADRLRSHGYSTLGVISNGWVTRRCGLDAGFDHFYSVMEDEQLFRAVGFGTTLSYLLNINERGGGLNLDTIEHPTDWLMIQLMGQYIERTTDDRPWFAYLHTKGVHSANQDYHPPPKWLGPISGDAKTKTDRYDDLLAWVDAQIPNLLNYVPDDAIIVITSDHGELLGEDGRWGHGEGDHEILRQVPLAVRNLEIENPTHVGVMNAILNQIESPSKSTVDASQPGESTKDRLEALGYLQQD